MKRATPPCSSIALLLRSSPPCTMLLTLTTASAVPLDDFGSPPPTPPSAFTNPPADLKAALDELTLPPANPGAIVLPNGVFGDRNTPRPDTEHLAEHHPAIRQPVGGGITGHQSAARPDRRAVHPAGDPDEHLLELTVFRGKGRIGDVFH